MQTQNNTAASIRFEIRRVVDPGEIFLDFSIPKLQNFTNFSKIFRFLRLKFLMNF